jgi:mRNA interferase MazF
MKPGDIVLIPLPQVMGGPFKLRPALLLANLPGPFQNALVCGVSTQLQGFQRGWDEMLSPGDADFSATGLHRTSAVRLSYLYAAEAREISGVIGRISVQRLDELLGRLVRHLTAWEK